MLYRKVLSEYSITRTSTLSVSRPTRFYVRRATPRDLRARGRDCLDAVAAFAPIDPLGALGPLENLDRIDASVVPGGPPPPYYLLRERYASLARAITLGEDGGST